MVLWPLLMMVYLYSCKVKAFACWMVQDWNMAFTLALTFRVCVYFTSWWECISSSYPNGRVIARYKWHSCYHMLSCHWCLVWGTHIITTRLVQYPALRSTVNILLAIKWGSVVEKKYNCSTQHFTVLSSHSHMWKWIVQIIAYPLLRLISQKTNVQYHCWSMSLCLFTAASSSMRAHFVIVDRFN